MNQRTPAEVRDQILTNAKTLYTIIHGPHDPARYNFIVNMIGNPPSGGTPSSESFIAVVSVNDDEVFIQSPVRVFNTCHLNLKSG